jgi:cation diffusion facilitator CzcD-associated flavoprotein CzcO
VAVVGTGSTASQVVPTIAPVVGKLYVYQRDPGWVFPKPDRDYSDDELRRYIRQGKVRYRLTRWNQFRKMQTQMLLGAMRMRAGTKRSQMAEKVLRTYINTVFTDRPDLAAAVTPSYPVGGKRGVGNQHFYPALLRENVELVPYGVTSVTPTGIASSDGIERSVDVIVMATGFQAANFLSSVRIVGRSGETLHEHWKGEPQAFVGIQVQEFPNFYMLYGPNTNGGEIFLNFKAQAGFAVRNIKSMMNDGVSSFEVKSQWEEIYNQLLQTRFRTDSVQVIANNYFKSPTGRIVTQWPYDAVTYYLLTRLLRRPSQIRRRHTSTSELSNPTAIATMSKAQESGGGSDESSVESLQAS